MGILVVLLVVKAEEGVLFVCVCVWGGGAWVHKERWEKKETSEAIISGRVVAVSLGVCVLSLPPFPVYLIYLFCNFRQFRHGQHSAKANNSL